MVPRRAARPIARAPAPFQASRVRRGRMDLGRRRARRTARAVCAAAVLACLLGGAAGARGAWTAYLRGPAHSSYDSTLTAITPANASTLALAWHFAGDPPT